MAYGDVDNVAALARVWTDNGSFTDSTLYADGTNPSLAQVTTWLEQVSATLDLVLATQGFDTPVTSVQAIAAIDPLVESLVVDLCHSSNSTGRFAVTGGVDGLSPLMQIRKELDEWVMLNAVGLEGMGVTKVATYVGRDVASFDVFKAQ